jgi:hypothetical protein
MHDVTRGWAKFPSNSQGEVVSTDPGINPACNPSVSSKMAGVVLVKSDQQGDLNTLKGKKEQGEHRSLVVTEHHHIRPMSFDPAIDSPHRGAILDSHYVGIPLTNFRL